VPQSKRPARSRFPKEEVIWEKDIGKRFITNTELLAFVLLVLITLALLFPGKRVEELVVKEEDPNYELSILYLEKLTGSYPERYDYKLALAKKAMRLGKDEYTERIYKELSKSKDPEAKILALTIIYDRLKKKYFLSEKPEEKISIKKEMANVLISLSEQTKSIDELRKYFSESISMDMPALSFRLAMLLSDIDSRKRVFWLEEAYKKASVMKDYTTAVKILDEMISTDTKNRKRWTDKKIEIALFSKDYTQAVNTCIGEMLMAKSYEEKKRYFKKALEILSWYSDRHKTAVLIETYYRDFLQDDEMALFILKKTLAVGELKIARILALEVLNRL
jgi:tetratricopeptide (TPR) repeat protein